MKRIKHLLLIAALLLTVSVFSKAQAQTYSWKNVTVPAGGFVSGIEFNPAQSGLVYARTDIGGVYRWDGTNSVWVPLTDMFSNAQYNNYGGESLAPDPTNANIVYVAAGMYIFNGNGVILRSTDQGNTWTSNAIAVPMGGNYDGRNAGERLVVDPNLDTTLYFASRSNGLWKSTNSASTWAQVTAFPVSGDSTYGLSYVIILPGGNPGAGAETIFAGVEAMASGNSNLYRSTNAGASWTLVPGGPSNMISPHADLATDGNLWMVYDSGGYGPNGITTGQIWKLNTSTLAWTHVTLANPAAGSGGYGGISVDAQNAQHVVVTTLDWWGGPDHIYSTTNGGTSWSVIGNAATSWDGYASPFSVYDNNGAIWTRFCSTYDGGVGWQGDIRIDPFNSAHAIYTTGGGVWDSSNVTAATQPAGVTWTFKDYGLEETAVIDMTASAAGGVFFSAFGDISGMRHTNLTQSPSGGMYCNATFTNTTGIDYAELNTNDMVRVGNSGAIATDGAYSTNNGQAWTPMASVPETGSNDMQGVALSANGATIVAVPANGYGNPSYSSNLGSSWTACGGLPAAAQIASDRVDSNIFYGTSGTSLYVSTNGGQSFSVAGTFAGSGRPRAVFGIAGEVWVPTGSGLYRFTNVGLGTVTTTKIANISSAAAVGFGKVAPSQTHPAVYLVGTVSGTYGFFRCDDGVGTTWVRINDNNHQYGAVGFASGDETVYGRMYVGTNGRGILYGDTSAVTPTSTPTASPTKTATPTATRTSTVTLTPTLTATATPSVTLTKTQTLTPTPSLTLTTTRTPTSTVSATSTATITATRTVTSTLSPTRTPSITSTPSITPTAQFTSTATLSPTQTLSLSPTASVTKTFTATMSPTLTLTSTPSMTKTMTPTLTATPTGTPTTSPTVTPTVTLTFTLVPGATNTFTATITSTPTLTMSPSATFTSSPTSTFSTTPTMTATSTITLAATNTKTTTVTVTKTATPTATQTSTLSPTNTVTPAATFTPTPQATLSLSLSAAPSNVSPDDFMTYTIQLVISNGSSNSTVLVLNLPTGVTVSGYTTGPSGSVSGSQVFWNLGTLAPGTYTFGVEVTVLSGTSGTLSAQAGVSAPAGEILSNSAAVTVTPWTATPTATAAVTPVSNPVIYPNPVNGPGPISIRLPNYPGLADISVKVYTTAFRLVDKFTALQEAGGSDVSLPLTDQGGTPLANGLYYVVVTTPLGKSIEKLLIIR